MQKRNKIALGIFAVFYVSFGAYISLNQERIIYLPQPGLSFADCATAPDVERVTHNGTRMFVRDTGQPLVVFYHGNADSVCNLQFLAGLVSQTGHDYLFVEYAGYSGDTQEPSHERAKEDVHNAITYLSETNRPAAVVMGQSIGTGAATYHVSLAPPEKVLLLSPFTDLTAVAKQRFWFYPTSLLVDNAFDNVQNLESYQDNSLIIHGNADALIPFTLGQVLHDSLPGDKTFVVIEGAGHNDLFMYPKTHEAIQTFLQPE